MVNEGFMQQEQLTSIFTVQSPTELFEIIQRESELQDKNYPKDNIG